MWMDGESNETKLTTVTALHKHIPISPLLRQYNLPILFGDLMAMSVTVCTLYTLPHSVREAELPSVRTVT